MKRMRQIIGSDRSASSDAGFTLVEVIVAMVVFSIIAVSVAGAITNSLVITRDARSRSVAQNLASQDLDQARAVTDVFAVQSETTTTTVQGIAYTIDREVEWQSSATTATACGTGTGQLQYKVVRDTVTYPGAGTTNPVVSSTVLAPNSRINDPTLGTIVVAVNGASGAGVAGASVSIVPTAGNLNGAVALAAQPAVTDSNGCTYALKVTPGNYTVSVSMPNGVDIYEVASPTKPAPVTAGTSTPVTFNYDTAAQLTLNYASNYSGGAVLPSTLPVTFSNTIPGDQPLPLNGATSVSLFPFTDGYTYEAGTYVAPGGSAKSCVDVDPGAWTTANSKGQVGASSYASTPSGVSAKPTNVRMGVVSLPSLSNLAGFITGGLISIKATSINSSAGGDPGCQTGVSYSFSTKSPTPTIALPFGTYNIYAGSGLQKLTIPSSGILTGGTANSDGSVTLDPRGVTP